MRVYALAGTAGSPPTYAVRNMLKKPMEEDTQGKMEDDAQGIRKKTFEDLEGVGPATAEKLREAGYSTIESIATASVGEIVDAIEVGERKAQEMIMSAKGLLDMSFETADKILEKKKIIKKITTGSSRRRTRNPVNLRIFWRIRLHHRGLSGDHGKRLVDANRFYRKWSVCRSVSHETADFDRAEK